MHKLITLLLVAVAMLGGYTWAVCGNGIPGEINNINGEGIEEQCDNGIYNGTNVALGSGGNMVTDSVNSITCTTNTCQSCGTIAGGYYNVANGSSCVAVDDQAQSTAMFIDFLASGEPRTQAGLDSWMWTYNSPYPVLFKLVVGFCSSTQVTIRQYKTADDVLGFQSYQDTCGPLIVPACIQPIDCAGVCGGTTIDYNSTATGCGTAPPVCTQTNGGVEICGDGVDQDCSGGDLACPPCGGSVASNATACAGTPAPTTATSYSLTTDCNGASACKYKCDSPYTPSGESCVYVSYTNYVCQSTDGKRSSISSQPTLSCPKIGLMKKKTRVLKPYND